jgi:hypothetical protein
MRGEIAKLRLETTLIEIKVRVHANTLVMPGLDPGIHPSRSSFEEDGLPGAQTSVRSLRKADYYARQ